MSPDTDDATVVRGDDDEDEDEDDEDDGARMDVAVTFAALGGNSAEIKRMYGWGLAHTHKQQSVILRRFFAQRVFCVNVFGWCDCECRNKIKSLNTCEKSLCWKRKKEKEKNMYKLN